MPTRLTFVAVKEKTESIWSRTDNLFAFIVSVTFLLPLVCSTLAGAQTSFPAPLTDSLGQTGRSDDSLPPIDANANILDINTPSNNASTTTRDRALPTTGLTSDQIINILQQNPDITVELKSVVSDRLQEQGTSVDANDISDEMLYRQISTNSSLRDSITTFLRARGLLSQEDIDSTRATTYRSDLYGTPSQRRTSTYDSIESSRIDDRLSTRDPSLPRANETSNALNRRTSNDVGPSRAREESNASTDAPKVLRQPTPYNLQSMRDLYTQIPESSTPLKRFGSEVFVNREAFAAARDLRLDVPLGPDYVVGTGDTLTITLWGGVNLSIVRMVDGSGRLLLPEAGSLDVGGLALGRVQALIEGALKQQYRNVQVAVTISGLRSVRVYVVGDVQRPGGYDISPISTPLSALYASGGPTAVGSLRTLRHFRGALLVEEVDLYDFLLHGIRSGSAHFESGDTLLVPPAGSQVAISGAVKRPAIYELKGGESSLASLVDDAGGFTASASPGNIRIERINTNRQRETVTLNIGSLPDKNIDLSAIFQFKIQDGDRIRVAPILPYSERTIYLEGHVTRPGRTPFHDGMHLSDVLQSYRDLLPEPASRGEIVRLVAPDLHAETIEFNVAEVLVGNNNPILQSFDTIRIFGRYGADAPKVTIQGEVLRPGSYPLSEGMTAGQLVRLAGGFKRGAFLDSADLTSYGIEDGNRAIRKRTSIHIGAAVTGSQPTADVALRPGDILAVHQISGWNDIGESITIEGQVNYPGSYGFEEGERLSSVLLRAGGFRNTSYPEGALLVREQVRELEEKSRQELIRQIQTNSAVARLSPNLAAGESASALQVIKSQQDEVVTQLKNHPPTGRLVVHISADIASWANTPADIELRRGDVLTIPKRPGFVMVTGQVYNSTALTFDPGKNAGWYLSHAGGTNATANRKEIFIIRANGSVVGRHSGGWFDGDVLSTRLDPGDVVVVPQKIVGTSLLWRNLLTAAQLASSIAITAAVARL